MPSTQKAAAGAKGADAQVKSLLDTIVGQMTRETAQEAYAREMLQVLTDEVKAETVKVDQNIVHEISQRIAELDKTISDQLNLVMQHEKFKTLEASWRGLNQLVTGTETSTTLKLRLLNISRDELSQDMKKATNVEQSLLFKKIYEDEYGTFGGAPFSLLIGDFTFGRNAPDIEMLTKISGVAAAAHAPFIAAADPKLFDMESFNELPVPRDLAKLFESTELIGWNAFRNTEDSRYVSLVLPRYLVRLPYDPENNPVRGLNYVEQVDGSDPTKYLWGNPAWQLGLRITDAFAKYRWCAAIRGVEGGGVVGNLPAHTFVTASGDKVLKCPTEVAITDRREKELDSLGFITLCHRKNTGEAVFFGGQTTNLPKTYNTFEANANARISGMLPYVLAASRFAHYLKVILRDKIGSFATRDNVQTYLNNWIADYVLLNDNAPQEIKAQYPLREARVDVTEVPGRPGSYRATVFLRPHFQLEELTASIRLVATLPPSAAA